MTSNPHHQARPRTRRRLFNNLAFVAIGVTSIFAVMILSGVLLFIAPSGRIAKAAGWEVVGLGRTGWEQVHIAFAFLFVIAGIWHLVLNRKVLGRFVAEGAQRTLHLRLEMIAALATTLLLLLFAVQNWPPVSWLTAANDYFKQVHWHSAYPDPAGRGGGGRMLRDTPTAHPD